MSKKCPRFLEPVVRLFASRSTESVSTLTDSAAWLAEHQAELFKKTALLINCEHTAAAGQELLGEAIRVVAAEAGFLWVPAAAHSGQAPGSGLQGVPGIWRADLRRVRAECARR